MVPNKRKNGAHPLDGTRAFLLQLSEITLFLVVITTVICRETHSLLLFTMVSGYLSLMAPTLGTALHSMFMTFFLSSRFKEQYWSLAQRQ